MEHFYTIQGEGFFTGTAAYFIRLGGCDVGCHWCDVKESWDASKHTHYSVEEIVSWPLAAKAERVVITGGEPLMYNLDNLTRSLRNAGLKTHIETSGAHPVSGEWDWFCLSPKKFKPPVTEAYKVADELKIIVFNRSDLDFAETEKTKLLSHTLKPTTRFYLQPEWSKFEESVGLIIPYVKEHPGWQVSLQVHKFMNIP